MRSRAAATLVVVGLTVAACGRGGSVRASELGGSGPAAAPKPLPDIEVVDLTADRPVVLRSLLPADRPLLVWFWAPH